MELGDGWLLMAPFSFILVAVPLSRSIDDGRRNLKGPRKKGPERTQRRETMAAESQTAIGAFMHASLVMGDEGCMN